MTDALARLSLLPFPCSTLTVCLWHPFGSLLALTCRDGAHRTHTYTHTHKAREVPGQPARLCLRPCAHLPSLPLLLSSPPHRSTGPLSPVAQPSPPYCITQSQTHLCTRAQSRDRAVRDAPLPIVMA